MTKPDVKINDMSMSHMGWLRESVDFPVPQSQTSTVIVPGRNAPIRYTEALGRVSYQPRSFTITLTMLGTRMRFNRMVEQVANRFAGQLVRIVASEEPELYLTGTLELTSSYDPLTGKGVLTLSCEDADAYRYHVVETIVSFAGSASAELMNDAMPVVPTVTTTDETTLTWEFGGTTMTKKLSVGSWTIPEMELQPGLNPVEITGNGSTTFAYREGRL